MNSQSSSSVRRGLRRYFSGEAMRHAFSTSLRRFPVAVVFLLLLSFYLIFVCYDINFKPAAVNNAILWGGSVGTLFSLAVSLWLEYKDMIRRAVPAQIIVILLILADSTLIAVRSTVMSEAEFVGRAALVTALVVAIFFMPRAKGLNSVGLWNYTVKMIAQVVIACALSLTFAIAVGIFFGTVSVLFNVYDSDFFGMLWTVFGLTVPAIFFMGGIPRRNQIARIGDMTVGSLFPAACKNVLLPLTALYAAVLYVYLLKILITWNLPNGSVCAMVTGLTLAVLVVLYGLRGYEYNPEASDGARDLSEKVRKCFPIALLPLLGLMSVAIFYRISEYGVTASRLYVATFNLWAYAVVFYLIFSRKKRLNSVAMSFAAVFLLVSIIPGLNFNSIANRIIRDKLITSLHEIGFTEFPVNSTNLSAKLNTLPRQQAETIASYGIYLDSWDDHSQVNDLIVGYEGKLTRWDLIKDRDIDEETVLLEEWRHINDSIPVTIPEGYTRVIPLRLWLSATSDTIIPGQPVKIVFENDTFCLNADSISRLPLGEKSHKTLTSPVICPPVNPASGKILLGVSVKLEVNNADTISNRIRNATVRGYIFSK